MIEQVPVARILTVDDPESVQTGWVFEPKATVSPEVDVALIPKGETPKVTLLSALNVIVCAVSTWIVIVLLLDAALPEPPP